MRLIPRSATKFSWLERGLSLVRIPRCVVTMERFAHFHQEHATSLQCKSKHAGLVAFAQFSERHKWKNNGKWQPDRGGGPKTTSQTPLSSLHTKAFFACYAC
jgi:hypothetical protein